MPEPYGPAFFDGHIAGSLRSARLVAPLVVDLVRPRSVVDVGCGRGAWLQAFRENGVDEVRGFDGNYVDRTALLIPPETFSAVDLRTPESLTGQYDLAVCLEVAEHLPPAVSDRLVRQLTRLAPVVLFSAAIPGQSGIDHINERWPTFWTERFARLRFRVIDAVRPIIRDDARVAWWYRQNILLFASETAVSTSPALAAAAAARPSGALEWIHAAVLHRYDSTRWVAGLLLRRILWKLRARAGPRP